MDQEKIGEAIAYLLIATGIILGIYGLTVAFKKGIDKYFVHRCLVTKENEEIEGAWIYRDEKEVCEQLGVEIDLPVKERK